MACMQSSVIIHPTTHLANARLMYNHGSNIPHNFNVILKSVTYSQYLVTIQESKVEFAIAVTSVRIHWIIFHRLRQLQLGSKVKCWAYFRSDRGTLSITQPFLAENAEIVSDVCRSVATPVDFCRVSILAFSSLFLNCRF